MALWNLYTNTLTMADSPRFLNKAVERASKTPGFMAWEFRKFMEIEGLSLPDLQRYLKISEDDFVKLALCGVPALDQPDLEVRIRQIGRYTNVSTSILLNMLQKVALHYHLRKSNEKEV